MTSSVTSSPPRRAALSACAFSASPGTRPAAPSAAARCSTSASSPATRCANSPISTPVTPAPRSSPASNASSRAMILLCRRRYRRLQRHDRGGRTALSARGKRPDICGAVTYAGTEGIPMVDAPAALLTAGDLLTLRDDGNGYRLVAGELTCLPPTSFRSSVVAATLLRIIGTFVALHGPRLCGGAD